MNAWCVPHCRGGVQGQRHLSCGAPTYEGSPASSAGSVHSISRWTSASPMLPCAAVGPSPCTTLSTGPLPCATPRSPAVRMCPRMRAATARAVCCAAGSAKQRMTSRQVSVPRRNRCQNPWWGVLAVHARRSSTRNRSALWDGPAYPVRPSQVADTHVTKCSCYRQVTKLWVSLAGTALQQACGRRC